MVVNGALGPVGQVSGVPNMIPMSVSQKEGVGLELFLFQKIQKSFRGVDGEEMTCKIKKVGVGFGKAAGEDQRFRHKGS